MRAVLLLSLILCSTAQAAAPKVRLRVEPPADGEQCLDEAELRRRVSGRLGYDPFDTVSPVELAVQPVRTADGRGWSVRVLRSAPEERTRARTVGPSEDCRALDEALALTLAIAIDPLSKGQQPAPPGPAPVQVRVEPPPPPAAPPALRWSAGVGLQAVFGGAPATVPGASVFAAVSGERLRMELELGGTLGGAVDREAGGRVVGSAYSASVLPCVTLSALALCGRLSGGVLALAGEGVPGARAASTPLAEVGARLTASYPLHARVRARASLDGGVPLVRTTAVVGSTDVWTLPPLSLRLGAGVEVAL